MYFSLIEIVVLNCYSMYKPLILIFVRILVHPFSIVWTQSIEVSPKCALTIRYESLCSVCVQGNLVIFVFDVWECSHWIRVSINIIILIGIKMSLIVLMLEQLPFHYKPSIWICIECAVIVNLCLYLEVQIFEMHSLCCWQSLYFPLVHSFFWNWNKCFHCFPLP